ncbi:MAG: winged helix-turn-helix transcriptional regulator [Cyanobacteria bacterium]|nr:winged helix-turn-helix transcriptional regulator [Cyanobacteriota bacterium]
MATRDTARKDTARKDTARKDTARSVPQLCTRFHYASELIGRRWNGAIIFMLLKQTCRFAWLRDNIPGITDRMLSERLQELEGEGVIERVVIPETPIRVEYSLTRKGRALAEAVGAIAEWAERYIPISAKPGKPAQPRRRASR